jgi:hypothetical protein
LPRGGFVGVGRRLAQADTAKNGNRLRRLVAERVNPNAGLIVDGVLLASIEPLVAGVQAVSGPLDFHGADALLEGLLEGAPDGHGLADTFHRRRQGFVGLGEFLEGEARHLHHAVVDRGLETGAGDAGDVVAQFIQRVAQRELGGELGDREAGGLGGQRAGARDAGIHLDGHHAPIARVNGKLDIGATGIHAHGAHDRDGRIAHALVFPVSQCERRRHGDRVAGVHAHRIEILDRADDHDVIAAVAHHFQLELFPAGEVLFNEHLSDPRLAEPVANEVFEFFRRAREPAARAAQRERRPETGRQPDVFQNLQCFFV